MTSNATPSDVVPSSRNVQLDVLRVLGLLLIILAHSGAPDWLMQLRSFDVPLMVLVSGAAFAFSSTADGPYRAYLASRVPRLIAPAWAFLLIYFPVTYLLFFATRQSWPYDVRAIVESFCLTAGIGYLWIIRVFVLVALCAPLIYSFSKKCASHSIYFATLLVVYGFYETLLYCYHPTGFLGTILRDWVFYLIPYGCLFGVGLRLPCVEKRGLSSPYVIAALIVSFALAIFSATSVPTSLKDYKYPPSQYFLWYGLAASLQIYWLTSFAWCERLRSRVILFMSSSTMWIYLWHILFLRMWNWYPSLRPIGFQSFLAKWLVLVLVSTIVTCIQKYVVRVGINHFALGGRTKACLTMAFLR